MIKDLIKTLYIEKIKNNNDINFEENVFIYMRKV